MLVLVNVSGYPQAAPVERFHRFLKSCVIPVGSSETQMRHILEDYSTSPSKYATWEGALRSNELSRLYMTCKVSSEAFASNLRAMINF